MGMSMFGSKSSYDKQHHCCCREVIAQPHITVQQPKLPNPDPSNYNIVKSEQHGKYLIVLINYPDCDNYEGNKILIYFNTTLKQLLNQKSIDPHFSENKNFKSPFARFIPNDDGWRMAEKFVKMMEKDIHYKYV